MSAAYQFYKMSKAENFMVGSFRTFLEKGLLEEREQEGSPAGSGRAEYSRTGYSWQDYSRPGYRREEFLERKYAPENVRSSERKAAACFYEEEGPYEYGAAEEDLEGKRYKEKEYKETGNKYLELFQLTQQRHKLAKELSKGMKQKLSMILALLIQPKALLVDEPMVGLDPASIEEVLNLLVELKNQGTSILISTHIIDVVNEIWDCAYIMNHGEIIRRIHRGEEGSETLKQIFFEATAEEE